jgi:hypothetical protein
LEAGKKGIIYMFIGGNIERDNLLEAGRKGITYGRQEGKIYSARCREKRDDL